MITGASTTWAQVSDMDRAVAFYRDVLGLTPGYTSPYWSEFSLGSSKIALHPPLAGSLDEQPKNGWFLGVETADIKELRAALETAGARVDGDFHDTPTGVVLTFFDPDGNPLQAMQRGMRAADL